MTELVPVRLGVWLPVLLMDWLCVCVGVWLVVWLGVCEPVLLMVWLGVPDPVGVTVWLGVGVAVSVVVEDSDAVVLTVADGCDEALTVGGVEGVTCVERDPETVAVHVATEELEGLMVDVSDGPVEVEA